MENRVHHTVEVLSEPAAMQFCGVLWSGQCLGPLEHHYPVWLVQIVAHEVLLLGTACWGVSGWHLLGGVASPPVHTQSV